MKNHKIIVLLLSCLIFAPGCFKEKAKALKGKATALFKGKKKSKLNSKEIDEFVLEIQNEGDIFSPDYSSDEKEFSWKEVKSDQKLENVQFEFDSSEIKKQEQAKIKTNARKLKKELKDLGKKAKVSVRGHSCKITKNPEYNYVLSQERAEKVAQQYKKEGISQDKIKSVGYGSSLLLTDEDGIEAQAPNRRGETVVVVEEQLFSNAKFAEYRVEPFFRDVSAG